jgi:hypothetical protein
MKTTHKLIHRDTGMEFKAAIIYLNDDDLNQVYAELYRIAKKFRNDNAQQKIYKDAVRKIELLTKEQKKRTLPGYITPKKVQSIVTTKQRIKRTQSEPAERPYPDWYYKLTQSELNELSWSNGWPVKPASWKDQPLITEVQGISANW